jgi:putative transposase
MKGKWYSDEQIFRILKEGEARVKIQELCRKHGIAEATFFRWKSKYNGLELSDLKRMKEVETENSRLKRIVADQGYFAAYCG